MGSGDDLLDHASRFDGTEGETVRPSLELVRELFVIDPQLIQCRGEHVERIGLALDSPEPPFVGGARRGVSAPRLERWIRDGQYLDSSPEREESGTEDLKSYDSDTALKNH